MSSARIANRHGARYIARCQVMRDAGCQAFWVVDAAGNIATVFENRVKNDHLFRMAQYAGFR